MKRSDSYPTADAEAIILVGSETTAGDSEKFTVGRAALIFVVAAEEPMDPGWHDALTPIELKATRANKAVPPRDCLPEPLAAPLQDIRIKRTTAQGFLVKARRLCPDACVDGYCPCFFGLHG